MAFSATITLEDSLHSLVSKRVEMETSVLADAQTAIAGLVTDLEAVTDLGVVSVTYTYKDLGEASAAAEGSSIDAGATFRLRLDNGKVASYKIPGFPISKASGGRVIATDDSDVVAYFDNFKDAGDFKISEGNVMTAILSGTLDV
jgi:hypothetical protein